MNPHEKGWLGKYLHFRRRQLLSQGNPYNSILGTDRGKFLYQLLQPTGLIYGHPVKVMDIGHPRENEWDESGKVKVLMTESFLSCGLLLFPSETSTEQDIDRLFEQVIEAVKSFYQQTFHEFSRDKSSFFNRRKSDQSRIEYLLDQRISIKHRLMNFWTGFFHNSLIYLDLIFFVHWVGAGNELTHIQLQRERESVRLKLLQLITVAARVSSLPIGESGKNLHHFFLESAELPEHKKRLALAFWNKGITLDDIDFSSIQSWVLKKYFLEIAIVTLLADNKIDDEEHIFLEKLIDKLSLEPNELAHSLFAIQEFMEQHKPKVHYLQKKRLYRLAGERYLYSLRMELRKNRRRLLQEIGESKELVALLAKAGRQELTLEEKEKVRKQLIDILKAIPAFTIFMLPGGSITLPLLLKILPKKLLYPSSFYED